MSKIEILDFFAKWCGPCKMMKPVIEELEKEYEGKVTFHKYDVDENHEETSKYQIMSIPTILIKKDDQIVNQLAGVQSKKAMQEAINSALKLK